MANGSSSSEESISWINWFCGQRGHEFFCEVDEDYILDEFNLTGLDYVPHYRHALDMILDLEPVDESAREAKENKEEIEKAAEILYGLIHSRFILTNKGLARMHEKWEKYDFGLCPRAFCDSQPVLPIGLSIVPADNSVKLYCPKCMGIYTPKSSRHQNIDGAYFGMGFPHMFFMVHPECRPVVSTNNFVPRLYGFKIHPLAYNLQFHTQNSLSKPKEIKLL